MIKFQPNAPRVLEFRGPAIIAEDCRRYIDINAPELYRRQYFYPIFSGLRNQVQTEVLQILWERKLSF